MSRAEPGRPADFAAPSGAGRSNHNPSLSHSTVQSMQLSFYERRTLRFEFGGSVPQTRLRCAVLVNFSTPREAAPLWAAQPAARAECPAQGVRRDADALAKHVHIKAA